MICTLDGYSIIQRSELGSSKMISFFLQCDDEMCKHTTRSLNLRVLGDSERGTVCPNYPQCNGHLRKQVNSRIPLLFKIAILFSFRFLKFTVLQYTEAEVYKQLSYFCHIFDVKHCIEKVDDNTFSFIFDTLFYLTFFSI